MAKHKVKLTLLVTPHQLVALLQASFLNCQGPVMCDFLSAQEIAGPAKPLLSQVEFSGSVATSHCCLHTMRVNTLADSVDMCQHVIDA